MTPVKPKADRNDGDLQTDLCVLRLIVDRILSLAPMNTSMISVEAVNHPKILWGFMLHIFMDAMRRGVSETEINIARDSINEALAQASDALLVELSRTPFFDVTAAWRAKASLSRGDAEDR